MRACCASLLACCLGCRPSAFDALNSSGAASEADAQTDAANLPEDAASGGDAGSEAGEQPRDAAPDPDDSSQTPEAGSEDAAQSIDAAPDAALDATQPADAAQTSDAAPADATADAGPTTLVLSIAEDRDDALWRVSGDGLEERLHFNPSTDGSAGYTIEVGTDGEQCRAGLRFALPIEPGARVLSASLRLYRVGPNADPGATMRVYVYDSASVGPFDQAHVHQDPAQHASGRLWQGASVGGYAVGPVEAFTQSYDLSELVQHVIDRPDWTNGGYIGFVLAPDAMDGDQFAQLRDSFAMRNGPSLTVTFTGP